MVKVRFAELKDAAEVARVHVDAWRFTYGGFMPDEFLNSFKYEEFEEGWRRDILENNPLLPRWVAELDGAIVGFLIGGDAAYEVPGYPNELRALYTKPGVQRQGVGTALMKTYQDWLKARGESAYHLWVGKQNKRAHAFYEANGGKRVAERGDRVFGGMPIPEWGYGWKLT